MQRTGYEWSALFRKMSTFNFDSPKRNQAPFSLKWHPPRKPPARGNFPLMYTLYRFLIVQIRIVALYILLLFATLYGKIHDFSMERCVQRTGYIPLDELILVWPAPKKKQNKKQKTNKKQGPFFFVSIRGKQHRKKVWNLQKALSLCTNKICRFEIIDGVKYVYCIKHAYKFLLREQVGFAAVLWRLRQCVSCHSLIHVQNDVAFL